MAATAMVVVRVKAKSAVQVCFWHLVLVADWLRFCALGLFVVLVPLTDIVEFYTVHSSSTDRAQTSCLLPEKRC